MKVPLKWLKKFVNLEAYSVQQIADTLTLTGLEVEKIEGVNFPFSGIVIGRIDEVTDHPNANKLKCAKVYDGSTHHQVVCGDATIQAGLIVAFAKVGAKLDLDKEKPFTISKAKLRDVESYGMLVAKDEIGLSTKKEPTIWHLPEDAPIGTSLAKYLYDPIFEVTHTPNLGYLRNMSAIARELSAHLDIPFQGPDIPALEEAAEGTPHFKITNRSLEKCPLYTCMAIENVTVGPSPQWLVDILESAGINSINNIVDITNFVMLELGQPMHAFDQDKLPTKHIVIDTAKEPFSFTCLDGKERTIPEGTLLIQDSEVPVALAGIMGGENSAITDESKNILLEAAVFTAKSVRKKSRAIPLRTESSIRFEYEVDHQGVVNAMKRAAQLIQEIAGGDTTGQLYVSGNLDAEPKFISCRVSRINSMLGLELSLNEVSALLARLGFEVISDDDDLLQIRPPSFRNDIKIEVDVIEEVGRIYGYNNIPRNKPLFRASAENHNPFYLLEKKIRARLISEGLQEFITCNLISPKMSEIELENGLVRNEFLTVLKPSSQDQSILRSSILPCHLLSVAHNLRVKCQDIPAFEIGRVHFREGDRFEEKMSLGITLSGKNKPHHFSDKPRVWEFSDLKGIIENLFIALKAPSPVWKNATFKGFHPYRQASLFIQDIRIGVIGEVHPSTLEEMDIDQPVLFSEIDLNALLPHLKQHHMQKALPLYPYSERDITIPLAKEQPMEKVFSILDSLRCEELVMTSLLDIYEDTSTRDNKKNVTLRFRYQSQTKTLESETIDEMHSKNVDTLLSQL